jgi:hypothetical protein
MQSVNMSEIRDVLFEELKRRYKVVSIRDNDIDIMFDDVTCKISITLSDIIIIDEFGGGFKINLVNSSDPIGMACFIIQKILK